MSTVVYVPKDAAALSVGADRVATMIAREAQSRGIDIILKRNGTRGMCWLEPLVEVVVGSERYAYGPVTERDVPGLFAADFLHNSAHALQLGRVDDIAYFASQQRLGIQFHETTPDGTFSLEPVYCLGNCACSPAVMIDEELFGRVSPEQLDALLAERGGD